MKVSNEYMLAHFNTQLLITEAYSNKVVQFSLNFFPLILPMIQSCFSDIRTAGVRNLRILCIQ